MNSRGGASIMTEHLIFVGTATLAVSLFVAGVSFKNAVDIAGIKVKVKTLCNKNNERSSTA